MFLDDLKTVIRKLQDQDHAIILSLDANGTISIDIHFRSMISQCDLHDLHQDSPPHSTYIGSSHRRIDYIFGCHRVKRYCSRSGVLSYNEGPQSDHRGMYADISLPDLYKATEQQPLSSSLSRSLFTRNPEVVKSYLQSVKKYYIAHKMEERMDQLFRAHTTMETDQVRHLLLKWDMGQGSAMKHAERSISRNTNQYHWSPKLRNSAILRMYWKLRLRELLKGHN
jgi:hypothetical protein